MSHDLQEGITHRYVEIRRWASSTIALPPSSYSCGARTHVLRAIAYFPPLPILVLPLAVSVRASAYEPPAPSTPPDRVYLSEMTCFYNRPAMSSDPGTTRASHCLYSASQDVRSRKMRAFSRRRVFRGKSISRCRQAWVASPSHCLHLAKRHLLPQIAFS